jgi:hypothetical protein
VSVKPLASLSGTLRGVLVANIAVSVAAVAADLYGYAQYSSLPDDAVYAELFLPSDTVGGFVALAQLGLLIAAAVVFLMWVHRANTNLGLLSGSAMAFTPGWSVVWFFIPLANLFKPYQVVKEIWLVSHRGREVLLLGETVAGGGAGLVGWWWCCFLVSAVAGRVASSLSTGVDDVAGYLTSALAYAVSDAVDVVGYGVTLLLVVRIAAAYAANIDEGRTPAEGEGAASAGSAPAGASGATPTCDATGGKVGDPASPVSAAGAAAAPGAAELPPAAWHPDPTGRHELRWWDGATWTAHVGDGGVASEDPV